MRLALVFNPFKYKIHEENIRIVQKYFGLFPPLSLAWVAAIAEKAGHQVKIIDARTLKLSKEETLAMLKIFKPDILGFMLTTYMFHDTLDWIRYLKKHLKVPVVVGGYNLRVYSVETLSHPEIDFGVIEHAHNTIPQLFKELETGRNFREVEGLVYKENGKIIKNPVEKSPVDFDKFPNPARHLLSNELYAEFPTQRKNFTVMVTSLGCPMQCSFCEAGGTAYCARNPETVAKEMEECYREFNIKEIDIFDYEFTAIRQRVIDICRKIRERNLDIGWACRSRVDHVDEELIDEMKRAGCKRIYFGIESGSQEILDKINKKITLSQIRDAIDMTKSHGIQTLGFFLIGAPGEIRESIKETLQFAKQLDLDYVQFSKCLAKPLTDLWKEVVKKTGRDYWREWILGHEVDRPLPRPWTTLSNDEIDRLTRWTYISYYSRLAYLLKAICKVKSFAELKRKVMAFLDMLFNQEDISRSDNYFQAYNENSFRTIKRYLQQQ